MGQRHATAKTLILLFPFIIVFFIVFSVSLINTVPTFWGLTIPAFYGFGFLFFLLAKLSILKTGARISSSSKPMSSGYRLLYLSGYFIMVLSVFLTLGLIISG